ncbi:MAG: ABC transporter ATP-binding protein [bacterium]|nr:ABC transporter ATP-binding protein [bacterium]
MLKIYRRLLRYLLPYWRRVILAVLCIILASLLSGGSLTLVVPFLDTLFNVDNVEMTVAAPAVVPDAVVDEGEGQELISRLERQGADLKTRAMAWLGQGTLMERLNRIILCIFFVFLAKNLFSYLDAYLVHYLEQRCLFDIRQDVYRRLQTLPMSFFSRQKTGMLISRVVNDVNVLRGAIIGATAKALRNGVLILILLMIIFLDSWKLALVTILVVPPNAWLLRRLGKLLQRDSTLIQERMGDMAGLIQETAIGARVVKAFGREQDEVTRFRGFNWAYFAGAVRLKALGALNAPMSEMLGLISVMFVVGYGGWQVIQGDLEASVLILFVTAALAIVGPLRKIAELNQVFQEGVVAGRRVFDLLDQDNELTQLEGGERPGRLNRVIRYESVGFSYDEGQPVLEDINLEIATGQVVALVGPSGGGKSTLADLLPRFHGVAHGRITMDDRDISTFNLQEWRAKMGIVTQDVVLFNDTIYNNIAYGRPEATREAVEQAARTARAHDFILQTTAGYDTTIGERGLQLSGGERQRLAIARAILRDPEILIFDEATSALDTESERLVQEAIERLMAGRTSLVIAHRLSTIRSADKIVAIQDGRIVEQGTHDELLAVGGLYRQLHDMQFKDES